MSTSNSEANVDRAAGGGRSPRLGCVAPPLLLVVLVSAAYSNSFHGPFIFDDLASIPENPSIRRLWPLSRVLLPIFEGGFQGRTVDGRPLLNLSLALNYAAGELDVRGYHATNLLIHLGGTLALFGIMRRTLLLPRWSGRFADRATWLAFAAALIWGIHPLQTESVTYVIQRAESLVGLLYFLTLYCVIRGHGGRHALGWSVPAVICCTLGMAAKEVMATAPLIVLLYDRVFVYGSVKEMLNKRWPLYVGLAAGWLLLALIMAVSPGRGASAGFGRGVALKEYAMTQFVAIVHYLRLSFVPYPLVLDYGRPLITQPGLVLPAATLVAGMLAATAVGFRLQPWIGFLGAWFFLILAPTSSILPVVTQTMAEHRMYLPLAAIAVLVVMAADWAWQRLIVGRMHARTPSMVRMTPMIALALVATSFGMLTFMRNYDYRTVKSIWVDTCMKVPDNPRCHANMVEVYLAEGDRAAAMRESNLSVELDPTSAENRYNRGTLLFEDGRFQEAIEDYTKAIELNPRDLAAWHNRGAVFLRLKEYDLAIQDFTHCLEEDPTLLIAYENRAKAYYRSKQFDKAEADVRRFLELGGTPEPVLALPEESEAVAD